MIKKINLKLLIIFLKKILKKIIFLYIDIVILPFLANKENDNKNKH